MICFHCIRKMFNTSHYFLILILFRMINLDNTNYVAIVEPHHYTYYAEAMGKR